MTELISANGYEYLHPKSVLGLDRQIKQNFAQQIPAFLIELGGEHVIPQEPEQILNYLNQGYATVYPDKQLQTPLAFAKADPWAVVPPDNLQKKAATVGSGIQYLIDPSANIVAFEIGSLYVHPDHQCKKHGRQLVAIMSEHVAQLHPNTPQIAVVTNDNTPSLHVFTAVGWRVVDAEKSLQLLGIDVLNGWTPPSTIFFNPKII